MIFKSYSKYAVDCCLKIVMYCLVKQPMKFAGSVFSRALSAGDLTFCN